jgi:hypothetical protein
MNDYFGYIVSDGTKEVTPSIIHGGNELDARVTFGSQEKYIAIEYNVRS